MKNKQTYSGKCICPYCQKEYEIINTLDKNIIKNPLGCFKCYMDGKWANLVNWTPKFLLTEFH